ncbi:helix-turn-helix domain-containing protein [Patescibacteria group bacterium]|nr:helix-turn-helix domain-containing protein [Patescibacteria group bacterium]
MKQASNPKTQLKGPDDFATIWEYLSSVREARGYTLSAVVDSVREAIKSRELEEQSALSRGYLSQLEAGRYNNPSPYKLKALALVYNIPYKLLLNKVGYWDETSKKVKEDASFTLMLKEVQDMTPKERESVLNYIEFVKSRRNQKKYDKSPKKG